MLQELRICTIRTAGEPAEAVAAAVCGADGRSSPIMLHCSAARNTPAAIAELHNK
jgi:hypothetical protein